MSELKKSWCGFASSPLGAAACGFSATCSVTTCSSRLAGGSPASSPSSKNSDICRAGSSESRDGTTTESRDALLDAREARELHDGGVLSASPLTAASGGELLALSLAG